MEYLHIPEFRFEISQINYEIGCVKSNLGELEIARYFLHITLASFVSLRGETYLLTCRALFELGNVHVKLGELGKAELLYFAAKRRLTDENTSLHWQLKVGMVSLLKKQGKFGEAEIIFDKALESFRNFEKYHPSFNEELSLEGFELWGISDIMAKIRGIIVPLELSPNPIIFHELPAERTANYESNLIFLPLSKVASIEKLLNINEKVSTTEINLGFADQRGEVCLVDNGEIDNEEITNVVIADGEMTVNTRNGNWKAQASKDETMRMEIDENQDARFAWELFRDN